MPFPSIGVTLERFLVDLLRDGKLNRASTEQKWASNIRAALPANLRPTVVGYDHLWKQAGASGSTASETKFGVTASKLDSSHALCDETLFAKGEVPYTVVIDGEEVTPQQGMSGAPPPQEGQEAGQPNQATVEESVERFIDSRHRRFKVPREYLQAWDDGALYGERYLHCFGEAVGEQTWYGTEAISPWECYRDMECMGELSDGEYYFRVQHQSHWRIWRTAVEDRSGVWFNRGALAAALNTQQNTTSTEGGAITGQTGTPEAAGVINRMATQEIAEIWAWVPKRAAIAFEKDNPRAIKHWSIQPEDAPTPDQEQPPPPPDENSAEAIRLPGDDTEPPDIAGDRVYIRAFMVGDKLCGYLPNPGPLPYKRGVWKNVTGVASGLGLADEMHHHQHTIDGLARSLDNSLKWLSTLLLAVQKGKLMTPLEDVFKAAENGLAVFEIEPTLAKSIRDAVETLQIPDITPTIISGMKTVMEFADIETNQPRIAQGQQPIGVSTAYELQQRLENSGKHMASKIREFDQDIEWSEQFRLDRERAAGNIAIPENVTVRAAGFRTFSKQISLYGALLRMLEMSFSSPEVAGRMRLDWVLWELAEAQMLDPERLWLSEAEYQQKVAAQQESPEAQAQMQALGLSLEKLQATIGKDEAAAQKLIVEAQQIQQAMAESAERLKLERAQAAVSIAGQVQDRRERRMLPPEQRGKQQASSRGNRGQ